jgi:YbbR domain-containing protein
MKKDRLLIIYAVLLALVMWGFVITRGQAGITIEVPVEFHNIPAGLTVTDGSNITVRVSVSGHERFIKQLGPKDIQVSASLEKLKKGENTHLLRLEDITLPPALKVSGLNPSVLHLRAEERATKKVPVMAAVTGLPAEGFAVRRIIVNPTNVTVEGVRKALKDVTHVYTLPVDIMSAAGDVVAEAELNMTGMPVTSQDKKVKVTVTITKGRR